MKTPALSLLILALAPAMAHAQDTAPSATPPTQESAPTAAPAQLPAQPGWTSVAPTDGAAPVNPRPVDAAAMPWIDPGNLRRRGRQRVERYDGGPIPIGMHLETRRSHGLLAVGAIVFGAAYLGSAFSVAACTGMTVSCTTGLGWLLVPVAGPFVASAFPQAGTARPILIADGIVQAAGIALLVTAIATARTVLVDDPFATTRTRPAWAMLPIGPNGSTGVSFSMTGF